MTVYAYPVLLGPSVPPNRDYVMLAQAQGCSYGNLGGQLLWQDLPQVQGTQVAFFPVAPGLWVLLLALKRPNGGVWAYGLIFSEEALDVIAWRPFRLVEKLREGLSASIQFLEKTPHLRLPMGPIPLDPSKTTTLHQGVNNLSTLAAWAATLPEQPHYCEVPDFAQAVATLYALGEALPRGLLIGRSLCSSGPLEVACTANPIIIGLGNNEELWSPALETVTKQRRLEADRWMSMVKVAPDIPFMSKAGLDNPVEEIFNLTCESIAGLPPKEQQPRLLDRINMLAHVDAGGKERASKIIIAHIVRMVEAGENAKTKADWIRFAALDVRPCLNDVWPVLFLIGLTAMAGADVIRALPPDLVITPLLKDCCAHIDNGNALGTCAKFVTGLNEAGHGIDEARAAIRNSFEKNCRAVWATIAEVGGPLHDELKRSLYTRWRSGYIDRDTIRLTFLDGAGGIVG